MGCFESKEKKSAFELEQNGGNEHLPPLPQSLPQSKEDNTVVALYPYQKRTDSDISFNKDDILIVLDKSNSDWWKARNTRTREEGYIPSNHVASTQSLEAKALNQFLNCAALNRKKNRSIELEYDWEMSNNLYIGKLCGRKQIGQINYERKSMWYFGMIKRCDSETYLKNAEAGTFLVRESETRPGTLSLSVRAEINESGAPIIKHFCIRTKSTTGEVFISNKIEFPSVHDLIAYYRQHKGLSIKLMYACPKEALIPETDGLAHDVWEIVRKTIELQERLGQGCFGEVWAGTWNNSVRVAIKTMKEGTMDADKFLEEANVMKRLRHPHILQLKAICSTEEPVWIITELMENGSLQDYLHKKGQTLVREGNMSVLINMAGQCASGMAYLEAQNFIHRDLAARNVLVGDKHLCKIADFGLSREDMYTADVKSKFPIKWTAPEAAFFQKYTIKSDVWSFGILMYEIITLGKVPYPGMRGQEVLEKIETGYRMPQPHGCPEEYYSIMKDCWKQDYLERPSFETLKWQLDDFNVAMEGQYDET